MLPSLSLSSSAIPLSQEFIDLKSFKDTVEDWAIFEKVSTHLDKLVTELFVAKCAPEDSCPFFIRCALNEKGLFAVAELHAEHTCVRAGRVARSVENTQRSLLCKVPEVIAIDDKMTPKQIVDNLRLLPGQIGRASCRERVLVAV